MASNRAFRQKLHGRIAFQRLISCDFHCPYAAFGCHSSQSAEGPGTVHRIRCPLYCCYV